MAGPNRGELTVVQSRNHTDLVARPENPRAGSIYQSGPMADSRKDWPTQITHINNSSVAEPPI